MKKAVKYILGITALLLLLFFSLDIRKLDAYKATNNTKEFNAEEYAREAWEVKLPEVIREAPGIGSVIGMLKSDPDHAFEEWGRKLGISKTWYFMARGEGMIDSVGEENLWITLGSGEKVALATGFIFGNTVRDGSGVVDIDEFVNMTDFNNVSVALNRLVKEEVVSDLLTSAVPGMNIKFAGAFEISEDGIDLHSIRIIPVTIELTYEIQ